jgi:enolase-phosphatase E1
MIQAVLCDIEGTTTSVSFVYDVLFPYARENLASFIKANHENIKVRTELKAISEVVGQPLTVDESMTLLLDWMNDDKKVTPLKALQGMVWEHGYKNQGFYGHVYEDVPINFKKWNESGLPVYIYSSGSIKAQQLLFAYTHYGDLTTYLSGYFDTTTGNKREHESYQTIAENINKSPDSILFLSDVIEELDAAKQAGMKTCLLTRDTPSLTTNEKHLTALNFNQISLD